MTDVTHQIRHRHACRACDGPLHPVLDLGPLKLNAFPQTLEARDQIQAVPLALVTCRDCGLCQLDRTVPADWMYRTYWYRSGVNEMMVHELEDVVTEALSTVFWQAGDRVLDIGANDGTLLSYYPPGLRRTAVEPATNLQERLRQHAEEVIHDYFPCDLDPGFRIISAVACSYDLEDPLAFFTGIHDLLSPGGVGVIQFQDLEQQIQSAAFDNIVHEHLEYYSLWSLMHLLNRAGLTIQRTQLRQINGGSLRVLVRRVEDHVLAEPSVNGQLVREAQAGLDTPTIRAGDFRAFDRFRSRVETAKVQIAGAIQQAIDSGLVIDVYGASTKGNILLQVLNLGPDEIRQAIDRSPEKEGYHTITGIPIVGEAAAAQQDPADLWISPIWQFRESVLRRERWYLERGGTILFPLPSVEIVKQTWGVVGV